ncbi:YeeE/YedE family protein [Planktomarina temperata]|nr:YeeE/YedE family protein [Planktomarina temperata]
MFEQLGFENLNPAQASLILALILGLLFGAIAQHLKFCFRSAVVGTGNSAQTARGIWFITLGTALLGTQLLTVTGYISFDDHRLLASDLPIAAILVGGVMFGIGMVLTRGCISRLSVLTGSGNLRALTVLVVFAILAHATLKGILAPLRVWLGSVTLPMGEVSSLAGLPGGAAVWALLVALICFALAARSGVAWSKALWAGLLGLLVPAGWLGTGFVLQDEFDPIVMQSLSFTAPAADLLFWTVASSAIPAGFGVGLILGVVLGAAAASLSKGEFHWQSFDTPRQTGRYFSGAALMGVGGVLAGGCTVGAGLAGIASLSIAALLALASIALGGWAMQALLSEKNSAAIGAH